MASKGRKRKKKKGRATKANRWLRTANRDVIIGLEYYNQAFAMFHRELARSGFRSSEVHSIRERFWQFIPPGVYYQHEGRSLLKAYLKSLEGEMSEIISKSSLGYWLHLYRRLAPGPIGKDTSPMTIGLTRALLESAIQKYARFEPCNRIGCSGHVPIEKVLSGLLMSEEFDLERNLLRNAGSQLVLTHFTHTDLVEFYNLEKLAYEVWRTGATLRTIGKGASFLVEDAPTDFGDDRSDELAELLEHYDKRTRELHTAATGAIFESFENGDHSGHVFLPSYNLMGVTSKSIKGPLRKAFKIDLIAPIEFNFLWVPFNLRGFRNVHTPLAQAFKEKYGVSLDAVLAVIASLCTRALILWTKRGPESFLRHWQRAYEGPNLKTLIRQEIQYFLPAGLCILGIKNDTIDINEVNLAIRFWELTTTDRELIELLYSGPHYVLLPFQNDRWFVDYAWILRRLHDLFVGVSISDQNYKGQALEKAVGRTSSVLPTGPCKASDGTEKQIDCAYSFGNHLIVVECKAVGRSIAYERGDPDAIAYRQKNVVERGLAEADEKATWIAKRPRGKNYDITLFKDILPIAVSPFVEFIPSKKSRYWISNDVPRVLNPSELREFLKSPQLIDPAMNRIRVEQSDENG
jgi:hypothetical protein